MPPHLTLFGRLLLMLPLGALAIGQQSIFAEPWTGAMGIRHTTAELMQRQQLTPARVVPRVHKLRRKPGRENLPQNPQSPALAQSAKAVSPQSATQAAAVAAPQTVSAINFTGATFADTAAFPPDTMGTVGPTQFLVVVNGRIRSFNKTTGAADGVLNVDTDVFFNSVMTPPTSSNSTTDPRVRYDRLSGRWIITIIDSPATGANRVMLAVSSSGTLTNATTWTYFFFQHDQVAPAGDTGAFADYPTLGVDANALYIGVNVFDSSGTTQLGTTGFVIRKSSILGVGPIVVTAFRGLTSSGSGPATPQGVDNFDTAASEGYFIGPDDASFGTLMIRRVSNPGGSPSISGNLSLTVPSTSYPRTVPHSGNTGGTSGYLDPSDDRLFAAVMRNGHLWTAHNINVTTSGNATTSTTTRRAASRWYEIQNLSSTPSLLQSGTVFDSTSSRPLNYFIPSIMVSGQGHVAMGFSVAGTNSRIDAATTGRLAGDPAGTMQTPVRYTSSSTAYNPSGDPGGTSGRRWGDYSYTSVDPDDDMTMWTIQEFCNAANSYGVRVVKLLAPPPATPLGCVPSSAPHGANNVSVVVTGTSSSGSGFFDPGGGFPKHLAASVNGGGVTVNSVTYTDPTHCTVNLSIASSAALGLRTITVTNPDGQAVTSASGIFTITPSANLSVTSSVSPSPVAAGESVTYTLSVTNNGPDTATGVTATDTLPVDVSISSVMPAPVSVSGDQLTFNLGNLAAGATSTITLVVTLPSSATAPGVVANTFTAHANESDSDSTNNSTTLSTDALPEVAIAQSGGDILISFNSVAGKFYRVKMADDLIAGFTTTLADQVPGTGGVVSITDSGAASVFPRRFYRVQIVPGP